MQVNEWHKCYESGWKDIIVPEAFSHPAKMSYGLLKRILAHAKAQGWLGGVIVDPFGGIGSTGILGAYEGYQVVCCELEAKFVKLAEQNFKLHDHAWQKFGNPRPVILQGDSRRLCEVVEKADCVIGSPPWQGSQEGASVAGPSSGMFQGHKKKWYKSSQDGYGQTPGQLGSMKPGNVDMVVSSPPYAESLSSEKDGIDWSKTHREDGTIRDRTIEGAYKKRGTGYEQMKYGQTSGNLGNLKSGDVDCVISSPPYEDAVKTGEGPGAKIWSEKKGHWIADPNTQGKYGDARGNLGNNKGDTFWQAARTIVEQCFQILKPGGHAIWVVKSFVRNKKIVDFPGDWQRLCESVGFKTVCIHHAMLVKETSHQTLFGHTEVKRTERKSFFRRLAESKGSPRIDYEVVLCMQTPTPVP